MDIEQDRQFICLPFREIAIDSDADIAVRRVAEMREGVPFGFHVMSFLVCRRRPRRRIA